MCAHILKSAAAATASTSFSSQYLMKPMRKWSGASWIATMWSCQYYLSSHAAAANGSGPMHNFTLKSATWKDSSWLLLAIVFFLFTSSTLTKRRTCRCDLQIVWLVNSHDYCKQHIAELKCAHSFCCQLHHTLSLCSEMQSCAILLSAVM